MVERVAIAIEGALPNQMKHLGPLLARAAIEAMHEPTEAMLAAGMSADPTPERDTNAIRVWGRMIAAATEV
jgi:hypothetical protein